MSRLFTVALLGCLMLLVTAAPAAAQDDTTTTNDGLQISSSTTYVPDPDREQIAVTATYTMTNLQADEVVGDSVRSFFYTKWVIALPGTAIDFEATSGGQPLRASTAPDPEADDPESADVVFGTIDLPFNLNFQQSVQLDVTFTIPGAEPRTGGTVARVNDSFLSFSVWAAGDPGRADVRIVIPKGFRVDLQGDLDELREETSATGETVLEAIGIQNPRDFFGQVFGRNDAGLLTATAELPGATATIRAWPDDPEWIDFVAEAIEEGVPVIEDLTGLEWTAGDIEVIETVTPYLFGYGGWFNASSGIIEIGDSLERDLILHELGHAWFNDELVDGRWITEGLAEEFASQAIAATNDEEVDPTEPDLQDPLRVPLAQWASPWTLDEEDAFGYEQYHYNSSWWVIRQITNDIGLDAFSEVLVALRNDDLPYPGEGPTEQTSQSTRWTHMFDLLEDRGATNLDTLFRLYVLPQSDIDRLAPRQVARSNYEALREVSAEWGAPLVLRQAMTQWQFDEANELIDTSLAIIESRDTADTLAGELVITVDHPAEMLYETAATEPELGAAQEAEDQLLTDLQALRDARIDLGDQARTLATTVTFLPMTFDDAVQDIAAQQTAIAQVADLRAQVGERASELDLREPNWPAPDGPTDFDAAAALAEARLATLTTLQATTQMVEAPRSMMQHIGLFLSDPGGSLDQGRVAFEADELDDALTAAASADMMINQAAATGRTRVLWASAIMVFMVVAAFIVSARQRHKNPQPHSTSEVAT